MTARDEILARIRANRPKPERTEPAVPLFDEYAPRDLLAAFQAALERMGGVLLQADASDPLAPIRDRIATKTVASMVTEIPGTLPVGPDTDPAALADAEYGIARAVFGVAETGSLCFTQAEFGVNTLGYLPQHLIALLDPADILPNLHHAYRRPELKQAAYAVFHTGPSATADIEGVLIHGAQGVRSLSVLPLPKPVTPSPCRS